MDKIHFDNLSKKKIWIPFLILALLLILNGLTSPLETEYAYLYDLSSAVGFLILVVFYSRMFWYKNYVQWNKQGVMIRINRFSSTSFNYRDVRKVEMKENDIIVYQKSGKVTKVDVSGFSQEDRERLVKIIHND